MTQLSQRVRKAAILVSSLDARSADTVLEQMDEDLAGLVRNTILDLDEVDLAEQEAVIAEFLHGEQPSNAPPGVELDPSLQSLMENATSDATLMAGSPSDEASEVQRPSELPFQFIQDAPVDTLATYLAKENPQIIAVVLTHMPAPRAGEILAHLPRELRGQVLARIARLQEADPNIVREVEQGLQTGIGAKLREEHQLHQGVSAVQSILESMTDISRSELLGDVAVLDTGLAKQLGQSTATPFPQAPSEDSRPPKEWRTPLGLQSQPSKWPASSTEEPAVAKNFHSKASLESQFSSDERPALTPKSPTTHLEFEDLAQFDDHALAAVFERAEPHIAFLALAGAPVGLVERIMTQLSPREAKTLRRRIENIGPVRLMDVELAQRHVTERAVELVEEGRVTIPRKKFSVAA